MANGKRSKVIKLLMGFFSREIAQSNLIHCFLNTEAATKGTKTNEEPESLGETINTARSRKQEFP